MKDRGAERAKEVLVRKAREHKTSFLAGNCQPPLGTVSRRQRRRAKFYFEV